MRVRELAEWLGATFEGDGEKELTGVAPLETAGGSELSFLSGRKGLPQAAPSAAAVLIVPPDYPSPSRRTVIHAPEPRTAFARAMNRFYPTVEIEPGIHPTAAIGKDGEIGALAAIGPHVSIGDSSRIGLASGIGPGCSIGKRVVLGEGCVLHANVTIYDNVDIGRGVILHSGCVIGADGFGYVFENDRYHKFPQVGRVEIGDFVEIGANSCVDRAALGVTVIGEGTKLDNMVHVGHNCRIGRHVVVAAQTGFSGGVVVEDYAVIGGQVGIGDKARIESRAVLGSGCGVLTSKIVRSGQTVWGTPARPLKEHLEQLANLARLPEMRRQFVDLKRRVAHLEMPTRQSGRERSVCPFSWNGVSREESVRAPACGPRSGLDQCASGALTALMETLLSTARKLGVNFFQYIRDRVSGAMQMPSLAELIKQRAETMNLGSSWKPT